MPSAAVRICVFCIHVRKRDHDQHAEHRERDHQLDQAEAVRCARPEIQHCDGFFSTQQVVFAA
jgi:hypothetical protein